MMEDMMVPTMSSAVAEEEVVMEEQSLHYLQPHDAVVYVEDKLGALLANNPTDFAAWTSLVAEIERASSDDIDSLSTVYDSFLSEFPLCYGYWKKYANHKARLCAIDEVVEVYERAVQAATYSVDLWINYCGFAIQFYEVPADIRRLFERGLSFVGKDYLCHMLWDKYIAFEYSHKQWNRLAHIYLRALRFPTKKLHSYYQSFRKLVGIWEEEMKYPNSAIVLSEAVSTCEIEELKTYKNSEISGLINDLLDQPAGLPKINIFKKYLLIGEGFYQKSSQMDSKIHCFEACIRRPYFHVKPLDDCQLENWHNYLDFMEMQGDFDWTVKLYERCLIPCANYPEFWIRYVEHMEAKGGREIANLALERASKAFLKRLPQFHHYCARFKEHIGDVFGARASFLRCDLDLPLNFINHVDQEANMEKRLGNTEAASLIYEKAIKMTDEKQDLRTLSVLYTHFARFIFVVTGNIDAAKEVFVKGILKIPHCKSLIKKFIRFMIMHGGAGQIRVIDSIVARVLAPAPGASQAFSYNDREDISSLFLEYVDLYGTIHEIRKAWDRHIKLLPHLMKPIIPFSYGPIRENMFEEAKEGKDATTQTSEVQHHDSLKCSFHGSDEQLACEDTQSLKQNLGVLSDGPVREVASNCTNGNIKLVHSKEDSEMNSEMKCEEETTELPLQIHEAQSLPQNLQDHSEYPKLENLIHEQPDLGSHDNLKPPSIENLSIDHSDSETRESKPSTSDDCVDHPDSETQEPKLSASDDCVGLHSATKENNHDICFTTDVEAMPQPNLKHVESRMPSDTNPKAERVSRADDSCLPEAQKDTQVPVQGSAQMPVPFSYSCDATGSENWHNLGQVSEHPNAKHTESVHPPERQQWQVSTQPQYPQSGNNPQLPTAQGYPCQSQVWQADVQQANQVQGQHQSAASQFCPTGTIVCPAQNSPQQGFVSGPLPQLISQPQNHVYQHPLQGHDQYGCVQGGHGVSSQFWHYYHQQMFHLQQLQRNQQLQQHPQQQPLNGQHMQPLHGQHMQQLQQNPQPQPQNQPQIYYSQMLQYQQQQQGQQPLNLSQQSQLQYSQLQQPNQQQHHRPQHDLAQPKQQELQDQQQHYLQQQHKLFSQQQLVLQEQQQSQHQITHSDIKNLNNSHYLQQVFPVQQYAGSQHGQEYGPQTTTSEGQGAISQIIEQSETAQPSELQATSDP